MQFVTILSGLALSVMLYFTHPIAALATMALTTAIAFGFRQNKSER